jgi:tetrahydromethanopterin S-methyltransferase subunit A
MPEFVSKLKGSKEKFDGDGQPKDSFEGEVAKADDEQNGTAEDFQLTDAEILQILNHMPSEPVEIHLMIEDLMSRMDEEKQNNLLQLITEYSNRQDGCMEEEEVIEEDVMDG